MFGINMREQSYLNIVKDNIISYNKNGIYLYYMYSNGYKQYSNLQWQL